MKILSLADFSTGDKAAIRKIIIDSLNLPNCVQDFFIDPAHNDIKTQINFFVGVFPQEASQLFNFTIGGLGPGEVFLYFLCDHITLSGYSSSTDIFLGNAPFAEVKSVQHIVDNWYGDFRLGAYTDAANYEFLQDLLEFTNHLHNPALIANTSEIPKTKILELRQQVNTFDEHKLELKLINGKIFSGNSFICDLNADDLSSKIRHSLTWLSEKTPDSFNEIEDRYFDKIFKTPLGSERFIFLDRKTAKCLFIGKLEKQMLLIERVTQGRIKPMINFNQHLPQIINT